VSRKPADKPGSKPATAPSTSSEDPTAVEKAAVAEELARLEVIDGAAPEPAAQQPEAAQAEPDAEAIQRLEREVAEWKDRALRGAADFENFRKRAFRERDEAQARGQSDIVARIVDVVDDLARVAHLDPATTTPQALHDGMLAIERKFMKVLEGAGIEKLDPTGQQFDPNAHEAVATIPAPEEKLDHTVASTYQAGYRLKGQLLRPARVAVYQWQGTAH